MVSDYSGGTKLTINNNIETCTPDPSYIGSYNAQGSLDTVNVLASKDAIPGKYIVPLGMSVIDASNWRVIIKI